MILQSWRPGINIPCTLEEIHPSWISGPFPPVGDRLLVIKDSFANCFVPFLAPYYREIVVVDPRYYSGTITDLMDTYRITDVLFLYSGNTFFTDNSISGVFASE